MQEATIRDVAILGAGNGGFAAAVDLTLMGFDVRLYGRSPETIAPVQARGGIEYSGALGEGFVETPRVTSDAAEAIAGADAVLAMVPTQAHEDVARVAAPHLAPDQIFFAAPGHTLTLLPQTLRTAGVSQPNTCESATLPYICRKSAGDHIRITRKAGVMKFAAFPATRTTEMADRLTPLFPAISPVPTVLDTVFPYTNAIHHPPALLCNIGRVESTGGDYRHYYDGISPSVGRIIDALDGERRALAAAMGSTVDRLSDYFFQIGYTNEAGRDGGTAYSTFHNSEPNRQIKAPSTIDHRFFNEDIPYGLVPLTELARIAEIAMPAANAVIELASIATGKSYRADGLTLKRLGLEGHTVASLKQLLREGFPA